MTHSELFKKSLHSQDLRNKIATSLAATHRDLKDLLRLAEADGASTTLTNSIKYLISRTEADYVASDYKDRK